MNIYLEKFIKEKFVLPGKSLDLGAGDFSDVNGLNQLGWQAFGVDKKIGIDLENQYLSPKAPFDLVYSNYLLQKINNKKQFVKTIFNNLKSSGWVFIQALDQSDKYSTSNLTKESIKDLFKDFKEVSVNIKEIYDDWHDHYHQVLELTAKKEQAK